MPRNSQTYICKTCGRSFESNNIKPEYCSRPCRDQNIERKARYSAMFRQIPDRPCVICGTIFRPLQRGAECCSLACANLKKRKHQRVDITHCEICGAALTNRQISNQNRLCSRNCHSKNIEQWHAQPENKTFMREHGARSYTKRQKAPTSIERAMSAAMDRHDIAYEVQRQVGGYVCDFVVPSALLVIETDGTYWHSLPKAIVRDKNKDKYLNACGYTVLRFSEAEIKRDVDQCVQIILSYL